mmetsp:Transcript_45302/g.142070  ORF Transcript_45302/g.142070 Transcript_45302/m.142070 type:complete len:100 (-) Transcript_45302:781-1080(-)
MDLDAHILRGSTAAGLSLKLPAGDSGTTMMRWLSERGTAHGMAGRISRAECLSTGFATGDSGTTTRCPAKRPSATGPGSGVALGAELCTAACTRSASRS